MPQDEIKRFGLRLPVELHAALKELAEEEMRSLHAEIIMLLSEAVAKQRRTKET